MFKWKNLKFNLEDFSKMHTSLIFLKKNIYLSWPEIHLKFVIQYISTMIFEIFLFIYSHYYFFSLFFK